MSHFICAHPDCKTKLRSRNISGVCQLHVHSPYCQCVKCQKHGPTIKRVERKVPDNVTLVGVRVHTGSNSSADSPVMAVSLPKPPFPLEEVS